MPPPPQEIRPYSGIINHHNPLIRPYFLGGVALVGAPLDSHDDTSTKYTMYIAHVQNS